MIKHITKRGGEVLNRLLLLLIVLSKVYMNSGSTHKDEVGRIWDLFKLSWALNLSMSIMLLHWPCCFFFLEAKNFFGLRFCSKGTLSKIWPWFPIKTFEFSHPLTLYKCIHLGKYGYYEKEGPVVIRASLWPSIK